MTQDPPNNGNTLNITQDDVVRNIERIIGVDGLEAARQTFKILNECFSGLKGWAETTDVVYDLLAEKRKEEKQQEREEKLETQRAAAANVLVVTKATSDAKNNGKAEIDKMDVDVNSPGNNVAKIIKLGKDDE